MTSSSSLFPYRHHINSIACKKFIVGGVLNLQNVKRYEMTRYFRYLFYRNSFYAFSMLFFSLSHIAIIINYNDGTNSFSFKTRLTNSFHPNKDYTFLWRVEAKTSWEWGIKFVLDVFNGFLCCQRYCFVMFNRCGLPDSMWRLDDMQKIEPMGGH